jgi:hypothetical protein
MVTPQSHSSADPPADAHWANCCHPFCARGREWPGAGSLEESGTWAFLGGRMWPSPSRRLEGDRLTSGIADCRRTTFVAAATLGVGLRLAEPASSAPRSSMFAEPGRRLCLGSPPASGRMPVTSALDGLASSPNHSGLGRSTPRPAMGDLGCGRPAGGRRHGARALLRPRQSSRARSGTKSAFGIRITAPCRVQLYRNTT